MGSSRERPAIVVIGPTASGKTALAIALARRLNGTVVNFDSMQVYAELRVLTARPTPAEEALVPHRLFGVMPAAVACSAALYREAALPVLDEIEAGGRLPVLAGGTGLYLRSLIEGISPVPDVPDAVRQAVRRRLAAEGPAVLHALLAVRDPAMAARLEPGDSQRLARAVEVLEATGRSLADWQAAPPDGPPFGRRPFVIRLDPPRERLYARIDARVDAMVADGVLDEVRQVLALGLDPSLPAMKAHGLREFGDCLAGRCTLEDAVVRTRLVTRHYAKRQGTWGRNQLAPDVTLADFIEAQHLERIVDQLFPKIDDFLLTVPD